MNHVGILGAGTWGAALARLLANKGEAVTVWSAVPAEIDMLDKSRVHHNLPQMRLPEGIHFTKNISDACIGMDFIIFATPSIYIRQTARTAKPYISNTQLVVSVAKGLEADTLLTMTQVIESEIGNSERIAALSGPTHAEEVALDMPTMIVSACPNQETAYSVQTLFSTDYMRVYTNPDVFGVEISGALKNVMALAAGISEGLGYGDNAKAALITRGIVEMARLGEAMGCDARTFYGLAGIGDLVVTATSKHSRNNNAGFLIGKGLSAAEAARQVGMVVEGLNALEGALQLSRKYCVEMPIIEAIDQIVNHDAAPSEIVSQLMSRQKKDEFL